MGGGNVAGARSGWTDHGRQEDAMNKLQAECISTRWQVPATLAAGGSATPLPCAAGAEAPGPSPARRRTELRPIPTHQRALATLTALALLVGPLPARAGQREIRCDSRGLGYNYCRVDTDGRVELVDRHSLFACREGRSWGYDDRGVWVDKGCTATFRVGSHGHSNKAAVAGALVGLAALAALAATRHKAQAAEVESWAVGAFTGDDAREGVRVSLRILPGGQVSGRAGEQDISGQLQGARLEAGRQVFRIEQLGTGFVAIDERDDSHRVTFNRVASGY